MRLYINFCLVFVNQRSTIIRTYWKSTMLSGTRRTFEHSHAGCNRMVAAPVTRRLSGGRSSSNFVAPGVSAHQRACRKQAHHQRPDGRQSAGPVQNTSGPGKVLATCESLDAPGRSTCRATSRRGRSQRPERRRTPHHHAQPQVLRHRGLAGREQHRPGDLSAHHRARVPPVHRCARPSKGDSHPRLPVHRRVARVWTRGEIFNAYHEVRSIRDKDEF